MERINTTNKAVDLFGAGKHGFQNGNPGLGVFATFMSAELMNALQEELANVIESTGAALNPASRTQLLTAINELIAAFAGSAYLLKAGGTMTGVLALPDGLSTAPALKVGDEQNGLYSAAANELAVAVAGAAAAIFSATSLRLGGAAAATGFTNSGDIVLPASGAIRSRSAFSAWVRHDAAGGIGRALNVGSVTKHATGLFTANIAASVMADGAYGFLGMVSSLGGTSLSIQQDDTVAPTATALKYRIRNTGDGANTDPGILTVGVMP